VLNHPQTPLETSSAMELSKEATSSETAAGV
jgi:hypothetical protein